MDNIIKKYIKGEYVEDYYLIFCASDEDGNEVHAEFRKGFIGKADNGRTIAITEYDEGINITDIASGLRVADYDFKGYNKKPEFFFKTVEANARYHFGELERNGYIDQMRKVEEWGKAVEV